MFTEKPPKPPDDIQGQTLGRLKRPFDDISTAHTVVRAMEQVGYSITDPDAFIRRVQHVEYGLSAEIEFAALLRWLGNCPFVHRLSEDAFSSPTCSDWQVPDLFAVFQNSDLSWTTAIEVKTTSTTTLRLKKDYLAKLQAYADMISQPLLLAWRPRNIGFWILVDSSLIRHQGKDIFELDLETAVKNDLMSMVAGDFHIVPEKGTGLIIESSQISEKQHTPEGYQAMFRIDRTYMRNSSGISIDSVPNAITWLLFSAMEEVQNVNADSIVQSFVATGGMTRAQLVLRTAASFPLSEGQRIHWKEIGTNLGAVINSQDLLSQAQAHIGTFVRYIFHQQPQSVPQSLPERWKFN